MFVAVNALSTGLVTRDTITKPRLGQRHCMIQRYPLIHEAKIINAMKK